MESTTIWCTPGYSSPMISGSKRISGARKRSGPIWAGSARRGKKQTGSRSAYLELVPVRQDILCDLVLVHLGGGPLLLLLARVLGYVGDGFLYEAHHLLLGARVEDVAALAQQRLQVLGHVAAGHVYAADA